jgi:nicotinic acid mononucleotide adenylyltransferase
MATDEHFYDAARLREHIRALQDAVANPDPYGHVVNGPALPVGGRLGLLAGSFNPPTVAHTTLAKAGLANGQLDRVYYVLSTHTVGKEVVTGAALEDRLLLLDRLAEADPRLGTLLINRGLFLDQARIARAAFPTLGALVFLVGFDKIVQIFDPRYYDDRDADLEQLFALGTFLVAPRGTDDAEDLAALLSAPDNRRFAGGVEPLDLPPELRDVASTAVRTTIGDGQTRDPATPPLVQAFIAATGVYAPDERYRRRLEALSALASADAANVDQHSAHFRAISEAVGAGETSSSA